jgi:hypothetical protein
MRIPNPRELAATAVLAVDLLEVSAKVRTGGPVDDPEDAALPHWAGVVPLTLVAGPPEPAEDLDPAVPLPPYLVPYRRPLQPLGDGPPIMRAAQYVTAFASRRQTR